jgi:uncharacterized RDD family membrane protein YckC
MAWAPPPTYGGPGGGLEYAGVGERFVAWIVDVIIIGLIGMIPGLILTMVFVGSISWSRFIDLSGTTVVFDEGMFTTVLIVGFVGAVVATLIDLAYFVLQWSSGARATLGMRMLGLQVGNAADGQTLDRGQALRRWFAMGSWLGVLGAIPVVGGLAGLGQVIWYLVLLITTASNPRRQGLHDQFAGTAVVQEAGRSNSGFVIGCVVLVVLVVVVLPVISIIALILLGGQVSTILSTVGESV